MSIINIYRKRHAIVYHDKYVLQTSIRAAARSTFQVFVLRINIITASLLER